MENKETKKKPEVKNESVSKMLVVSACNTFKINGYYRSWAVKRYKNDLFTKSEWKEIFKKEGLVL